MENLTTQDLLKNVSLTRPRQLDAVVKRRVLDSYVLSSAKFPLENTTNLYSKRIIDLIFSSFVIICVLTWLIPLIALFIKLDSKGPVFFLQKRKKKGKGSFTCIKLRTMVLNQEADSLPAYHNDHRITRVGSVLRKHHLDELPQFFNVWLGQMSLIGPRPYMISDNQKYENVIPSYHIRHRVKPGMTGLAQSMGFKGTLLNTYEMNRRVELDIYYIHNWSFILELRILYRTLLKLFYYK